MSAGGRRKGAGRPPLPEGESERSLRRRKLRAQAQLEELRLAREKLQLIDARRAESSRFTLERCLRDRLLAWPTIIAGQFIGMLGEAGAHLDATVVAIVLDRLVNILLHDLSHDIYTHPGYGMERGRFALPYVDTNGNGHASPDEAEEEPA